MGTILGPMPLFLLGHHSLTQTGHSGSTCDPHRHRGNAESWKTPQRPKALFTTQGQRKVPLPLVQTVLQVTGFPRDRDQTHASPRGRIGTWGVCVRDVRAPREGLRQRKPCGGSTGHVPTNRYLVRGPAALGRMSPTGPLERRVTGIPVQEKSEQCPSQVTGAPIT